MARDRDFGGCREGCGAVIGPRAGDAWCGAAPDLIRGLHRHGGPGPVPGLRIAGREAAHVHS